MTRPYNLSEVGRETRAERLNTPHAVSQRIKTRGHIEWTPDLIAAASILWKAESTVSEIALVLGVKKNQISGMVHRNRAAFPSRGSPMGKNAWSA